MSYTTHFTLTALISSGTQFRIRNSLVESDYLSQVFLRHELLLLSFCFRFLLMKQQPWTKEAGNSWVYQVQEDLRTSYRPFTWLQVWVFVSHVWINNENRHLVEKYEHAPSFHWKTLGYVQRTTKIYLPPTRGLSGAELISDSKSLMSGLCLTENMSNADYNFQYISFLAQFNPGSPVFSKTTVSLVWHFNKNVLYCFSLSFL